ncbi:MAG: mannose-1-phosphate guanylyltransferase, partial [Pseudomonadota bacterium]|nr:mannose-1-phosphate guanylyltransferase [Pseudomonadota bacterium]
MALIYPVILCGGSGTRLWPLSRRSMPKQFLNLTGKDSLFQQAALRVSGPEFEETFVITANDYRFIAAQQLVDIGIKSSTVLLEPSPKNTAPAILAAAEKIYQEDPDALMLVVSSDHYIPDRSAFIERVVAAKTAAKSGSIVTFGIKPVRPETGYGYIETGQKLSDPDSFAVAGFHEKPDKNNAEKMIKKGGYLWNSGIFLMKCEIVLKLADFDSFAVAGFHEKPDKNSAEKMREQGGYLWNSGIFLMKCEIVLKLAEQHVPNMLRSVTHS